MSEDHLPPDVEAAYDALCDAVLRADSRLVPEFGAELVQLLCAHSDGADLALLIGLDLIDGWINLGEQDDGADDAVPAVRTLILDALMQLGDSFPDPVYADAYEQRGLEVLEAAPGLAVERLRRAVAIAGPGEERAGYLLSLVLALVESEGATPEAAALAEEARGLATAPEIRDHAEAFLIQLLCDLESPRAADLAFERIATGAPVDSADLGEALMRALVVEAARCEDTNLPFTAELAAGLRFGLGRVDWVPDPLTASDFATLVAWVDVSRDDLAELESTMALAPGPFSGVDIEAQAALIRVLVALDHLDVIGMESALRRAGPLVTASGAPGIVTAYRIMAELVNSSRNGAPLADVAAEFSGLRRSRGEEPGVETALMHDTLEAFKAIWAQDASGLPGSIRARLDEWCAAPSHPNVDLMMSAILWAFGAASAVYAGDVRTARTRLDMVETARAGLDPGSGQARWLAMFVNGLAPVVDAGGNRVRAGEALREIAAEHRRAGNELGASVADGQLALTLEGQAPEEALAAAVRALEFQAHRRASLPGSTERTALRAGSQAIVASALRAAARLEDPRSLAELLEFLRAQELPTVAETTDPAGLPLALLLPPAAFGAPTSNRATSMADVVGLAEPRRVRMPWGGVAMERYLPPHPPVAVVDLVVPLPSTDACGGVGPAGPQRPES